MEDNADPGDRLRPAARISEQAARMVPLAQTRVEEAAGARPKATHPPVGG